MNRTANGHSAEYIKRQANKIKKQLGVPMHEALDIASMNLGFSNWENFINSSTTTGDAVQKVRAAAIPLPTPLVLKFFTFLGKSAYYRPNARMSLKAHQEVADILNMLRNALEYNKRALNAVTATCNELDEWVQKEYTDRSELPDNVHSEMYYGNDDNTPAETSPTPERIAELQKLCLKVKHVLKGSYHDCKPLQALLLKMDQAIKWMDKWPAVKKDPTRFRVGKEIPSGSLVFYKNKTRPAILISHDKYMGRVVCYSDQGVLTLSRSSVTVPTNQSLANEFKPMRLWLPYGKATTAGGEEFLFNRDYMPIWKKSANGTVSSVSPTLQIDKTKSEVFFNDGNAPWHRHKDSHEKCFNALKEWSVENKNSELLNLIPEAIATGNVSLLKPDY